MNSRILWRSGIVSLVACAIFAFLPSRPAAADPYTECMTLASAYLAQCIIYCGAGPEYDSCVNGCWSYYYYLQTLCQNAGGG